MDSHDVVGGKDSYILYILEALQFLLTVTIE
jgi:hypothetical protein